MTMMQNMLMVEVVAYQTPSHSLEENRNTVDILIMHSFCGQFRAEIVQALESITSTSLGDSIGDRPSRPINPEYP